MERLFRWEGRQGQVHEDGTKLGMCWESGECDLTGAEGFRWNRRFLSGEDVGWGD